MHRYEGQTMSVCFYLRLAGTALLEMDEAEFFKAVTHELPEVDHAV